MRFSDHNNRRGLPFLQLILVVAALMGILYYYMKSRTQQVESFSRVMEQNGVQVPPGALPGEAKTAEEAIQKTLDSTMKQKERELEKAE